MDFGGDVRRESLIWPATGDPYQMEMATKANNIGSATMMADIMDRVPYVPDE